ncbi:hypothetical protein C4K20_4220 [Pseudomonas chlororaphis subsp. aurantiaca]|nr:hypothetical protein C4K20_4220 [Pseudomonas chlororaphis subsp. aurantiaca]
MPSADRALYYLDGYLGLVWLRLNIPARFVCPGNSSGQ